MKKKAKKRLPGSKVKKQNFLIDKLSFEWRGSKTLSAIQNNDFVFILVRPRIARKKTGNPAFF